MQRIVLGKSGLEINRMGLGGIPIQRLDEDTAVDLVVHAIAQGVDFIDTSRAYSNSETRIGKALQKMTRRRVVLASKSHQRSADGILKDIKLSLKNLQSDHIDLYQCHFVKDHDDYQQVLATGGALDGLRQARDKGLIGHFGLTSHSLDLLNTVIEDGFFETIMVCYSFLEPAAAEKVIPKALAQNLGVIAMKSFSGGVLHNPETALRFVLAQPGVAIIPGVEDPRLFDANWRIYTRGDYTLAAHHLREIDDTRARYDKRFCRRCDYCQPCTEEIPIQTILGLRSVIQRFGPQAMQKAWIRNGIAKAEKCTQCGECMPRCPYDLEIPELIQQNLNWLREKGLHG